MSLPNFGVGLGAAAVGDLAATAEAAGWDGFFLWDHLLPFDPGPVDVVDPWMALAVAATRTSTIRLGTAVTPLPRRRPVKLAREVTTLDHLSAGRVTLGLGIGAMPYEWEHLGEEPDLVRRGDMLDEGLDLLVQLWSGEPVRHRGEHYRVAGDAADDGATGPLHPRPVQRPRVPVWLGCTWPGGRAVRRAARWDGVLPMRRSGPWTAQDTADVRTFVARHRDPGAAFDLAVPGETAGGTAAGRDAAAAHAEAGATWFVEAVHPWRFGWPDGGPWPADRMAERVAAGPPRP